MSTGQTDYVTLDQADTLAALFLQRSLRTPDADAYRQYDPDTEAWITYSWAQTRNDAARWQAALAAEDLSPGDRVAILLRNSREWVMFDMAALGLGLVTVPLYTNDRPENIGYILQDAGVKLLLVENNEQWQALQEINETLATLSRIVTLENVDPIANLPQARSRADWLPAETSGFRADDIDSNTLATIVYTSGTTGRSKGVMLSHRNILWNIEAGLKSVPVYPEDSFLSFLPMSHTLERTVGYYMPIVTGASVAFARSVPQLAEDLLTIRPTILVTVPRIFERVSTKIHTKLESDPAPVRALFEKATDVGWRRFLHEQGRGKRSWDFLLWPILDKLVGSKIRAKLGGRLRFAVCGGAPLSAEVAKLFLGLGVRISQGYGLTETSPIITCNALNDNDPTSVGRALQGVEVVVGDHDELLTRSPSVMLGYWNRPDATLDVIDEDGWLHTGDKVNIEDGRIYITGRLKDIIVLANGEKISPNDMEMAIAADTLLEQVMVVGEGKPFLSALVALNEEHIPEVATELGLDPQADDLLDQESLRKHVLERIKKSLHSFPGYAKIFGVRFVKEPWGIDNGLMTPTLKLRRAHILKKHASLVEQMYEGH